jgi:hypothetical protein
MHSLSAFDIVQIWEIGQGQHPLDRALTLLSFAVPELTWDDLASLAIGQRDHYLLTLRELTLGSRMDGFAQCPQCQELLEFDLNVRDVRVRGSGFEVGAIAPTYKLTVEGVEVEFRLPTSRDLAAIVHCRDLAAARLQLAQRCTVQVSQNGVAVAIEHLPAAVLTQLGDRMVEFDPQAEVLLDLSCPACHHSWQVLFDIVSFFWAELNVQAKRLLREVHTLARFYGWREADILAMSAMRRQCYLDMVNG